MQSAEFDCIEHTVLDGQRWDTLAWIYYGDAGAYGRIVQANPALDITTHVEAGTVVLVGVPRPDMTLELPFIEVFGRGGSLKSSWYGDCLPSRDFPMLVQLHQQGRLPLDKFVSETISLDAVEEAFHKMERGEVLRSVVVL